MSEDPTIRLFIAPVTPLQQNCTGGVVHKTTGAIIDPVKRRTKTTT